MSEIFAEPVPPDALLSRHAVAPNYADCFVVTVPGPVSLAAFVQAFYTTPLFRLERAILCTLGHASTDAGARAVGEGSASGFAAWTVEAREGDELLLRDVSGRTRSWFMVAAGQPADGATRLSFGSAVLARPGSANLGSVVRSLLWAHRIYARALLAAAASRLAG